MTLSNARIEDIESNLFFLRNNIKESKAIILFLLTKNLGTLSAIDFSDLGNVEGYQLKFALKELLLEEKINVIYSKSNDLAFFFEWWNNATYVLAENNIKQHSVLGDK